MTIEGCPRRNDQVSRKACEGCEWLYVEGETVECMLEHSVGGSARGRRLRRSGTDLSRERLPGEEAWFPPPPPERSESPMPLQDSPRSPVEDEAPPEQDEKAKRWKKMFLDEKLEAVEDSIVEYDPTMPPEHPDMMDLVERSIERTWVPPSDDAEECPPETSPEIEEPSTDPLPALPSPPDGSTPPVSPPADDPLLNPEELTDPFGRPLPPLSDETSDESAPGLP